ncbi:MAG: M20/M25/M40 family metallo-hydrolase [Candidatus Uhrbacteria bacterium]
MKLTNVEKNLLKLLRVPSPSNEEQNIIEVLNKQLSPFFEIKKIPVTPNRHALLCLKGNPKVILAAHIDTVKGNLPIKISKTKIFGRGSCDNKGSAAAMITAGHEAIKNNQNNFGLLFTIGEEVSFDGAVAAKKFLAKHHLKPKLIIIGEPTDLKIVTAQYGVFCFELTWSGTAAHSSILLPDSAIHKMINDLKKITVAKIPQTVFHVAKISGGTAANVIADEARAMLTFRSALPDTKKRIETILKKMSGRPKYKILKNIPATNHSKPPFQKNWVRYFTEMAFLPNSIVLGPGSIKQAHSKNEFVPRSELNKAVEIYKSFLR